MVALAFAVQAVGPVLWCAQFTRWSPGRWPTSADEASCTGPGSRDGPRRQRSA